MDNYIEDDRLLRANSLPDSLVALARTDPVVHLCLSLYLRGDLTLPAALERAVLGLSEMVTRQSEAMIEQLNTCTCRHRYLDKL